MTMLQYIPMDSKKKGKICKVYAENTEMLHGALTPTPEVAIEPNSRHCLGTDTVLSNRHSIYPKRDTSQESLTTWGPVIITTELFYRQPEMKIPVTGYF